MSFQLLVALAHEVEDIAALFVKPRRFAELAVTSDASVGVGAARPVVALGRIGFVQLV